MTRLEELLQTYGKAQTPAQASTPTPLCPTHGAMKPSTKGTGYYCPHKLDDDTWCTWKAK
jgi:hypothetical protein